MKSPNTPFYTEVKTSLCGKVIKVFTVKFISTVIEILYFKRRLEKLIH